MLITEEYKNQQHQLHSENIDYGSASMMFASTISFLMNEIGSKQVLDYGCGKGRLGENLKVDHDYSYYAYDPALEQFSTTPEPRELVCCIDVLEHIEPEYLEHVLDHLQVLTTHLGFFTIHTGPAKKVLPDGRNAHLIQEPITWWLERLEARFKVLEVQESGNGFVCFLQKQ
jgi:2-polyprenyl-3-methyl-5-hydroxy-6-metoxy-1,4-benzoquinol methylase